MRIAVTGATGFLGSHVVELALERGYDIVATSRGLTLPPTFPTKVKFVAADLLEKAKLAGAFEGCEVVIHTAALSADWGRAGDFARVNVLGTRAVADAADAAGVSRLVHISSTSVYFMFADRLSIGEDSLLPKPVNAYARSKRAAEDEARRFRGATFVMRPRGLFGPGDPHLLPRLVDVARRRKLPLLHGGAAKVDITHVLVAADAALAMATCGNQHAGTYNISHGEPVQVRSLVERLLAGIGQPFRWRAVPVGPALATARIAELAARLDPRGKPPMITAYALGLLAYSQTLDLSSAMDRLGWKPPICLEDGLDRTIAAARGRR